MLCHQRTIFALRTSGVDRMVKNTSLALWPPVGYVGRNYGPTFIVCESSTVYTSETSQFAMITCSC